MKIGNVTLDNPFILGPMAGITDSVFRRICKSWGCGLVFSEMISSKGLYYNDEKTEDLLRFCNEEKPLSFQIFGSDPEIMAYSAGKLSSRGNDILDINMGCPVQKVVKSGDGSALLKSPDLIGRIVKAVVEVSNKPVTVKIRIGWDSENINVIEVAKIIEYYGASALTVHGRTREQLYGGKADWQYIRKVKNSINIPVIGSGDIFSGKDAVQMLDETGCDGVMIARGARGNPWIFREALHLFGLAEKYTVGIKDKIQTAVRHFQLLVDEKGEYIAVREIRKHVGWYLKGLPHAADIRRAINTLENKEDIISLLENYLEENS